MNEREAERAAVVAALRVLSRKNKAAEDRQARHGAYASSSESAHWRMGVEAAIALVERGEHRKETGK